MKYKSFCRLTNCKLTILIPIIAIVTGCVTPFPEKLQGTSKTSFSEDKIEVPDVKIPLKITYMGMDTKMSIRVFTEEIYAFLDKHTQMEGDKYLTADISPSSAPTHAPQRKMDYSTDTYKMISKKSLVKYAAIKTPDGEELAEYKCDVEITATTVIHMQDIKSSGAPGVAIKKLFALAEYNCMADLIDQMNDDIDQINSWNNEYINK